MLGQLVVVQVVSTASERSWPVAGPTSIGESKAAR